MTIKSVDVDREKAVITVVAEFGVPHQSLWDAYADAATIERFWGPPTFPAKFLQHDMTPGGFSKYEMTGPGGEVSRGYWKFISVSTPDSFVVQDGFANDDGTPNEEMPTIRMQMNFGPTSDGGSRLVSESTFGSTAELDQLIELGMLEGMESAMGQIDAVLAER